MHFPFSKRQTANPLQLRILMQITKMTVLCNVEKILANAADGDKVY